MPPCARASRGLSGMHFCANYAKCRTEFSSDPRTDFHAKKNQKHRKCKETLTFPFFGYFQFPSLLLYIKFGIIITVRIFYFFGALQDAFTVQKMRLPSEKARKPSVNLSSQNRAKTSVLRHLRLSPRHFELARAKEQKAGRSAAKLDTPAYYFIF